MERNPADEVLLSAVRLAMAISVEAADEIGGVSAVQLRALAVLRATPDANLAQLAQAMRVTVSTASRLVDRLVAAGLASRRPAPRTRREIALSLTTAGSSTLDRYDQLRLDGVHACLGRLDGAGQENVVGALAGLLGVRSPAMAERSGGSAGQDGRADAPGVEPAP